MSKYSSEYAAAWYKKNREKVIENVRKNRLANPEKIKARNKSWYARNREKSLAQSKAYREKHQERLNAYDRDYYRRNKVELLKKNKIYNEKNREKRLEYSRKRYRENPERSKAQAAAWRKRNRGKVCWYSRKNRYGITKEEFDRLLSKQKGVCGICLEDASDTRYGLGVDHCHRTKKVRGLLCHRCNMAIGSLGDDPERIKRAAAYVKNGGPA